MDGLSWPDPLDPGVLIALVALAFAIASFWWLHARRGNLRVARPNSYVFAKKVRLRLPLAFSNTGAVALIVSDLRVIVEMPGEREPLPWIATLPSMRRSGEQISNFATPLTVAGRSTREVLAEFGDGRGWDPEPSSRHMLRVQAKIHASDEWTDVGRFDWWAPPTNAPTERIIPYRNAAEQDP